MDNWKWNKKRRTKSSSWNFIESCNIKMTYKVAAYLRLSKEEYSNEKLNLSNITRLELGNKVKCIYIDKNKNVKIDIK